MAGAAAASTAASSLVCAGLPPCHQSDPVPGSARLAPGRLPPSRPPPAPRGRRALPPAGCPGLRGGAALQQPDCLRRDRDSSDIAAPPPPAGGPANHDGSAPPPPPLQPIAAPAQPRPHLPAPAEFPGRPGSWQLAGAECCGRREALERTRRLSPLGDAAPSQRPRRAPRRGRLSVGLEFTVITRLQATGVLQKPWASPQKRNSKCEKEQPQGLRKLFSPGICHSVLLKTGCSSFQTTSLKSNLSIKVFATDQ